MLIVPSVTNKDSNARKKLLFSVFVPFCTIMKGSELKNLRESRNLSQRDLAKILDITHTSVSRWEDGQEIPSPMQKLLRLFFQGLNPFGGPLAEPTKIRVELEEEEFEELRQLAIRKGFDTLKSYLAWVLRKHLQETRMQPPTVLNAKDPYRPLYPESVSKVAEDEVPFRVNPPPKGASK